MIILSFFFMIRGTDIQKITRFICLNTMHTLKEHMNTNLKNNQQQDDLIDICDEPHG